MCTKYLFIFIFLLDFHCECQIIFAIDLIINTCQILASSTELKGVGFLGCER